MSGVTILRSYEVLIGWAPGWSWIGLICTICALVFAVLSIYIGFRRPSYWRIWLTLAFITGILVAAAIVSFSNAVPIYEVQYDAYLSGTINMTLFAQKYEIVRQDGLLFILRTIKSIT